MNKNKDQFPFDLGDGWLPDPKPRSLTREDMQEAIDALPEVYTYHYALLPALFEDDQEDTCGMDKKKAIEETEKQIRITNTDSVLDALREKFDTEQKISIPDSEVMSGLIKKERNIGRAEGEISRAIHDLLVLVDERKITISSAGTSKVLRCTDITTLDHWFLNAIHAGCESDVFSDKRIYSLEG